MAPTRKIMTRNDQTPSEVHTISMRLSNYVAINLGDMNSEKWLKLKVSCLLLKIPLVGWLVFEERRHQLRALRLNHANFFYKATKSRNIISNDNIERANSIFQYFLSNLFQLLSNFLRKTPVWWKSIWYAWLKKAT